MRSPTIFAGLGAFVVDTDAIAREVVAPNSDGLMEIARVWPHTVRDGTLDRAALADIVFADASARERLNALLHPHIRRLALEREARAKPGQLIVHVVPLLFETGTTGSSTGPSWLLRRSKRRSRGSWSAIGSTRPRSRADRRADRARAGPRGGRLHYRE